jgi:hypothetical protein
VEPVEERAERADAEHHRVAPGRPLRTEHASRLLVKNGRHLLRFGIDDEQVIALGRRHVVGRRVPQPARIERRLHAAQPEVV